MKRYYMLNKPRGYVSARSDSRHKTVMDLFPEEWRYELHPVGRLDIDTEGLMIFTDDGQLDRRLVHPSSHIEKCYRLRALGDVDDEMIQKLEDGIEIYGTEHISRPARFVLENRCRVRDVIPYLPPKKSAKMMNNPDGCVITARITITEGKRHQVKMMLRSAGCHVFALERLSMGSLMLDESLPRGGWRELTVDEVNLLCPSYLDEQGNIASRCEKKIYQEI